MVDKIKFPKNDAIVVDQIQTAYENKDYREVSLNYQNVLNNIEFYIENYEGIIGKVVESLFLLKNFDDVVLMVDTCRKNSYESFFLYFYMFSSLIARGDIFYAKKIIFSSKLLKEDSMNYYFAHEEANYTNIKTLSKELFDMCANCLIVINFICGVTLESNEGSDVSKDYLLCRFFDLINIIFELGYPKKTVDKLTEVLDIIFDIK